MRDTALTVDTCRRRSRIAAEDLHIGDLRLEVYIIHMRVVGLCQPLQMRQQLIGNESPELVSQCLATRVVRRVFRVPTMFDSRRADRGIISTMIIPTVEGVHHPVVRAHIGHLAATLIELEKRRIRGITVEEIESFLRRPDDRRR